MALSIDVLVAHVSGSMIAGAVTSRLLGQTDLAVFAAPPGAEPAVGPPAALPTPSASA